MIGYENVYRIYLALLFERYVGLWLSRDLLP
jgi:hypothetical protein